MSAVGTVSAVWRFPVKSMLGEQIATARVDEGGILGDRAFALVDGETGKVASAKHPKLWPRLLYCRATFLGEPEPGEDLPPVRIDLADGSSVRSDAPDVHDALSEFFGRPVRLSPAAPDDYTIDQYHPDLPDLDPQGHRDEVEEIKLGAAFYNERGLPSAVPDGSFFDLFPLSVMTTSAIEHLNRLAPDTRFDVRRFRMNLIVDTDQEGFVENAWVDRILTVGDEVRIAVALPDPRCVMPSLDQPGLDRDPGVLKALAEHNRLDIGGAGLFPCAGVYAVTQSTGTISTGDTVALD